MSKHPHALWKRSSLNKFKHIFLRYLLPAAGTAILLLLLLRYGIMPYCCPVERDIYQRVTPGAVFYDRSGQPVHCITGDDHRYCFPVKLSDLPEHLISAVLAAEDHRFYEHNGVDNIAVFRAVRQLLTNGRIVSGASTITMQLVKMLKAETQRRTLKYKFVQAAEALYYERLFKKDEILEQYFNVLPYGGQIYGIEAAARYYFGRPAKDLNLAESILLSGLPQAPSRLRPDRHPQRARKRFEIIVSMLERQEYFTAEEAAHVLKLPLRYRDFSLPFLPTAKDPLYFTEALKQARAEDPRVWKIHTAYDPALTETGLNLLKNALPADNSVADAAMVIMENRTGIVRTMIGTLDFKRPEDGQVNAVLAKRSPGSLLKPFFFGEAISGGLIVPETLLQDTPIPDPEYRPGNFSGKFMGKVTATEALSLSLNTPAVRLLRDLGVRRMTKKLAALHLFPETQEDTPAVGLALALGGKESDLLSLTTAYAGLPDNRIHPRPSFLLDAATQTGTEKTKIWNTGNAAGLLLRMMRTLPLPGAERLPAAWKTGTSNNSRDAWCIALLPDVTVGVWFGNKNGKQAKALVGISLAAPVAGKMLSTLHGSLLWQNVTDLKRLELCEHSGLTPTIHCRGKRIAGEGPAAIPLRTCSSCLHGNQQKKDPLLILSPVKGTYRIKEGEDSIAFPLRIKPAAMHCYINGVYQGIRKNNSDLVLKAGRNEISFWDEKSDRHISLEIILTTSDRNPAQ